MVVNICAFAIYKQQKQDFHLLLILLIRILF